MNQVRSEISESPLSRNMARLLGLFLSRVKKKMTIGVEVVWHCKLAQSRCTLKALNEAARESDRFSD